MERLYYRTTTFVTDWERNTRGRWNKRTGQEAPIGRAGYGHGARTSIRLARLGVACAEGGEGTGDQWGLREDKDVGRGVGWDDGTMGWDGPSELKVLGLDGHSLGVDRCRSEGTQRWSVNLFGCMRVSVYVGRWLY